MQNHDRSTGVTQILLAAMILAAGLLSVACTDSVEEDTKETLQPPPPQDSQDDNELLPPVDTSPTTPGANTPSPESVRLGNSDSITIVFSASVDTQSLVLGGDLAKEAAAAVWPDDKTLQVSPTSIWHSGKDRTLVVGIADASGMQLETAQYSYDIATVYVSIDDPAASDDSTGTRGAPFASIQAAIAYANNSFAEASVLVAEGTYEVDGRKNGNRVEMMDNVSLYGSYAADWSARDRDAHTSRINNTAVGFPVRAASLTTPVVIDGFQIDSGIGESVLFIWGVTDITVRNNLLTTESSTQAANTALSLTLVDHAIIEDNEVVTGSGSNSAYGISVEWDSRALVSRNFIHGTSSKNGTNGILTGDVFGVDIFNNVIVITGGSSDIALRVYYGSTEGTRIVNNTFYAAKPVLLTDVAVLLQNNILHSTGTDYCLDEVGPDSIYPTSLTNNNFTGCTSMARFLEGVKYSYFSNFADIATQLGIDSNGSISVTPVYKDLTNLDLHLTADNGTDLSEGGVERSDLFTVDKDSHTRTDAWTIGAYEQD